MAKRSGRAAYDPSEVRLYNLASFLDMVESGVSDDEDLRIFEIGWNG